MKKFIFLLAFIGIVLSGTAQKQYEVRVVSKTKTEIQLNSGFVFEIDAIRITNNTIAFSVKTIEAKGKPILEDDEDNLKNSVQSYPYDPAIDNLKTVDQLLKETFEKWLDDTFGKGNYVVL